MTSIYELHLKMYLHIKNALPKVP